jgi:hypothetical protein
MVPLGNDSSGPQSFDNPVGVHQQPGRKFDPERLRRFRFERRRPSIRSLSRPRMQGNRLQDCRWGCLLRCMSPDLARCRRRPPQPWRPVVGEHLSSRRCARPSRAAPRLAGVRNRSKFRRGSREAWWPIDPEQTSAPCWISMSRTQQLFDVCRTPQVRQ